MYISENLKRLRKELNITQEELAGFLSVTSQAVSKWEADRGYPDVALLPTIAQYFNVTIDELVGMEKIRGESEAEKLLETVWANSSEGKIAENIELLREGVRKMPGNYAIWRGLAGQLTFLRADKETRERNNAEAIEIYERILAHCTESDVRNRAQAELCYAYDSIGEREKAAEIAATLPTVWFGNTIRADFLDGAEKRKVISGFFLNLTDALDWQFNRLYNMGGLTPQEKIELCEKSMVLFDLIFGDGELLHLAVNYSERCLWLARAYMELRNYPAALDALERAVPYAIEYDSQPERMEYTSLLLRGLTFDKSNYGKDYAEPWRYWFAKYISESEFEPLFGEPRYAAILDKLHSGNS
jgi:transcriptional regulator with XRE-family HTH domain